jgi:hypothetical protein
MTGENGTSGRRTQGSVLLTLGLLALATISAWAQPLPDAALEPLPADPEKRLYYGKNYDPARYKQCMSFTPEKRQLWGYGDCQQYALKLEPFDPKRREEFGEKYDLRKYHECVKQSGAANRACDRHILRRQPQPEYWPHAEVQGIKWPEAPQPPTYRRGMNANEYFEALCKREAGEFIYRVVEGVESVYVIRPRKWEGTFGYRDRYVMEDPYGFYETETSERGYAAMLITHPKAAATNPRQFKFSFIEYPLSPLARSLQGVLEPYMKVTRDMSTDFGNPVATPRGSVDSLYGFTWRGINRPRDREMGIAGGELAVVDLKTGEILGIRRGFGMTRANNINWEAMPVCPAYPDRGFNKDGFFTEWFIRKVVVPKSYVDLLRGGK